MTDVLFADRDVHFAEACVRRFQERGIRARHACSGSACLRMTQEDHPGIVIVSMTLDGVAGFTLVMRLWELPEPSRPSLIAVLALAPDPEDVQRSRALGCSGYFVRSTISIGTLIHRICAMRDSLSRSSG